MYNSNIVNVTESKKIVAGKWNLGTSILNRSTMVYPRAIGIHKIEMLAKGRVIILMPMMNLKKKRS